MEWHLSFRAARQRAVQLQQIGLTVNELDEGGLSEAEEDGLDEEMAAGDVADQTDDGGVPVARSSRSSKPSSYIILCYCIYNDFDL